MDPVKSKKKHVSVLSPFAAADETSHSAPASNDDGDAGDSVAPSDKHYDVHDLNILQCAHCLTIVAHTSCGFQKNDACEIVCVRAATNIELDVGVTISASGRDLDCTYRLARCNFCKATLGQVYVATSPQIDHLRGMYTLRTARVVSHRVGDAQTPDGAAITADPNLPLAYLSMDASELQKRLQTSKTATLT